VILICILVYLPALPALFTLRPEMRLPPWGVLVVGVIVATVFVFLLATKGYSAGTGIVLGILT
jgi:hypothetical protein